MPVTVQRWTGRETRALREAIRMSIREFAAYLGMSVRAVSKWEAAGSRLQLRPDNQAILDTALSRTTDDARARLELALAHCGEPRTDIALRSVADAAHRTGESADRRPTATRVHPTDGKRMLLIPAGDFLFGPSRQPHSLPEFFIDAAPVTNEEYGRFVASTGHSSPPHWPDGSCPDELHDHPVVYVTHDDATRYAAWAGKRLPSEAEWEKAARGATGNAYPWGDQPTPAKCNVRDSGPGRTTPVERYHSGVSSYGVYDLSGNVWEWCSTETAPGRFVLKGSAFTSPFTMAAASATNDAVVGMMDDDTGFRCVAGHVRGENATLCQ